MVRVIWGLLVGALVWWLIRRWLRQASTEQPPLSTPPHPEEEPQVTRMVACAHCGLHLPESDAISTRSASGTVYHCSPEHARANPNNTEQ